MPYIPPEVVEQARQIDLLTYLQSCEPQELVRISIHITQRTRGTKQSPCLFRLKLQLLHTHHDVLPHRVFVGMIENFARKETEGLGTLTNAVWE